MSNVDCRERTHVATIVHLVGQSTIFKGIENDKSETEIKSEQKGFNSNLWDDLLS